MPTAGVASCKHAQVGLLFLCIDGGRLLSRRNSLKVCVYYIHILWYSSSYSSSLLVLCCVQWVNNLYYVYEAELLYCIFPSNSTYIVLLYTPRKYELYFHMLFVRLIYSLVTYCICCASRVVRGLLLIQLL